MIKCGLIDIILAPFSHFHPGLAVRISLMQLNVCLGVLSWDLMQVNVLTGESTAGFTYWSISSAISLILEEKLQIKDLKGISVL